MTVQRTIALLSGGIDSATAASMALEAGQKVIGLSFDYGQRHLKELQAAEALANDLNLEDHLTIKIDFRLLIEHQVKMCKLYYQS